MGILLASVLLLSIAHQGLAQSQAQVTKTCKKAFSDDHDCRLNEVNKLRAHPKTAPCFRCPDNVVEELVELTAQETCLKEQTQKCIGLPHDVRSRMAPQMCKLTTICLQSRLKRGSRPFDLEQHLTNRCGRKVDATCESWMRKLECTCTNRALQGCRVIGFPQQDCSQVRR